MPFRKDPLTTAVIFDNNQNDQFSFTNKQNTPRDLAYQMAQIEKEASNQTMSIEKKIRRKMGHSKNVTETDI